MGRYCKRKSICAMVPKLWKYPGSATQMLMRWFLCVKSMADFASCRNRCVPMCTRCSGFKLWKHSVPFGSWCFLVPFGEFSVYTNRSPAKQDICGDCVWSHKGRFSSGIFMRKISNILEHSCQLPARVNKNDSMVLFFQITFMSHHQLITLWV